MRKILFVTSEAHPLIKTGGLADVSGSLPKALADLGEDIRIVLPNYQGIHTSEPIYYKSTIKVNNAEVNILETRLPGTAVTVWLVDYPKFFKLPGNPYHDETGKPWDNSAERFGLFCHTAAEIAMNRAYLDWKPEIVHCNDWQSGLVPALLTVEQHRPATLFTIHNMAYQGVFPRSVDYVLNLPQQLWDDGGIEFHGMLSFLKSGLAYSDRINTVSPSYAMEIQTAKFGCGLEGLLSYRRDYLSGIINGIDSGQWNPETDVNISTHYNLSTLNKKSENKTALQKKLSLPINKKIPVFGLISRLVDQKGIDLLLESMPEILQLPLQLVILGSGDKIFEQQLLEFAEAQPKIMAVKIGYDEALSHQIEAGSDVFLMPSRFEPCGLNQMYSLRYGTIPIVNKVGGLGDTVVDTVPQTINDKSATGIVFDGAFSGTLLEAIKRALMLYDQTETWKQLQVSGMRQDFSWKHSALQYIDLYKLMGN
jgi:starch synthase